MPLPLVALAAGTIAAPPTLDIEPWPGVAESFHAAYRAILTDDEGNRTDVTGLADWSIAPAEAGVFDGPTLLTDPIPPFAVGATVTATYDQLTAESPTTILPTGGAGNALAFTADGQIAEVPPSDSLTYPGEGGWTIEAWVRPNELPGAKVELIAGQVSPCLGGFDPFLLYGQNGQYAWSIDDTSAFRNTLWVDVPDLEWTHLAGVCADDDDGRSMTLYVNGVEVGHQSLDLPPLSLHFPVMIGRVEADCYSFPSFLGAIDEVRIWSVARTQEEVRTDMFSRLEGPRPGLVASWPFDEEDGQLALDHSGNANDAVLGHDPGPDDLDPSRVPSDAPIGPPPCPADFDEDGSLTILDFVSFQSAFQAGHPGADCNGDAALSILDFVCFQQAFTAGCR